MNRNTIATLLLAGSTAAVTAQPLETRDDLLVGTLDNGLTYMIKEHGNPENRAGLYLHVSAGSLNETDDIRGIAHYLEHMAFNGSTNFEPTEVVSFFESMGLSFGRHQNAFTSFDQTTYILNLPDADLDTIDKGLLFFDDVAGGLTLLPEEIESERGIIQEERRTRLSPQQRVQEQLFEAIAPGSTFGYRLPIGTEETINSVQRDDFVKFYETYYTASNMTLMVVADRDPTSIVPIIEKYFADDAKVERPADLPVGVTPYTEMRAEVFTDPELTNSQIRSSRSASRCTHHDASGHAPRARRDARLQRVQPTPAEEDQRGRDGHPRVGRLRGRLLRRDACQLDPGVRPARHLAHADGRAHPRIQAGARARLQLARDRRRPQGSHRFRRALRRAGAHAPRLRHPLGHEPAGRQRQHRAQRGPAA
ncbi:MAG: pitrilysin family protein [Planctomycetota bacterium]